MVVNQIVLNTFDTKENITKTSEIPKNTLLSTTLDFKTFVSYMNKLVLRKYKQDDGSYYIQQGRTPSRRLGGEES